MGFLIIFPIELRIILTFSYPYRRIIPSFNRCAGSYVRISIKFVHVIITCTFHTHIQTTLSCIYYLLEYTQICKIIALLYRVNVMDEWEFQSFFNPKNGYYSPLNYGYTSNGVPDKGVACIEGRLLLPDDVEVERCVDYMLSAGADLDMSDRYCTEDVLLYFDDAWRKNMYWRAYWNRQRMILSKWRKQAETRKSQQA